MCLGFANPTFVADGLVFAFISSMATTWWMVWVLLPVLSRAVALILDFISAVIQLMRPSSVAGWFVLSSSLDQTFLSSQHIFCLMIESMWLLSILLGKPTSFNVLCNNAETGVFDITYLSELNDVLRYRIGHISRVTINGV